MMQSDTATAIAPATVANVIVGFDILGFSIPILSDKVTVSKINQDVKIKSIRGVVTDLPYISKKNTAGYALQKMISGEDLKFGFSIEMEKGIPLGSGLGGSSASAVAAVVAANSLLERPLGKQELFKYALYGETVSSGSIHGDNVAASLFGGLTMCINSENKDKVEEFRVIKLPVPDSIYCLIAHPKFIIETRLAREVITPHITISQHVLQSMNLSAFIAGCYQNNLDLIQSSLNDLIIEPQRAKLIPGFNEMKSNALENGAMGCSISGAGPSIFAWCSSEILASSIKMRFEELKESLPYEMDIWITKIDTKGAYII